MNAIVSLLLATVMLIPTPTLVLKSGKRINVDEPVRVDGTRVLFRSNRTLFMVLSADVDFESTRAAGNPEVEAPAAPAPEPAKLKVAGADREKLLRDLEKNHEGVPATKDQLTVPKVQSTAQGPPGDEWQWRNSARAYEEEVLQAKENLAMLLVRREELRSRISGLVSNGYRPVQFSYETTLLAWVEEQIPYAELEVRRAERAQWQFLDDARKQNVLPGWLR